MLKPVGWWSLKLHLLSHNQEVSDEQVWPCLSSPCPILVPVLLVDAQWQQTVLCSMLQAFEVYALRSVCM